jgi:hypothetical protein
MRRTVALAILVLVLPTWAWGQAYPAASHAPVPG